MSRPHVKQEMDETHSRPAMPQHRTHPQTQNNHTPTTGLSREMEVDSQATMAHEDHTAMRSLGADTYRLIQGIQKLAQLNISTTLPSLPKFAVVGDQSAGKSSIVEALCGINMPRGQGTCTRCPFLITTSSHNSSEWTCTISIRLDYYATTNPNGTTGFRPCVPPDSQPFATVTDKKELGAMLRRAQLAILNPKHDPQAYVTIDVATIPAASRQVAFSPNVICLAIKGPELPDLSFYDLPGSINVIEDGEDEKLVSMIRHLVMEYTKDEQCRILLACGADQDVETSTTFGIIKKCKAEGRCAGVLTKADLLQPGKGPYVQQILGGSKFALGKGWFITKQLSQAEIDNGTGYATAREMEAAFFGQQPWVDLPEALKGRFGIPMLQEAVSRTLRDHILESLPDITTRVQDALSDVSGQLELFPERPVRPALTVMSEIQRLSTMITSVVEGNSDVNIFRQAIQEVITSFKQRLVDAKPRLEYKTPGYKAPSISLDSDDDDEDDDGPGTPTPSRTAIPIRATATPSSSRKRPAPETTPNIRNIKPDPSGPSVKKVYKLDLLRQWYEQGSNSSIPGSINSKVTDRLILEALCGWDPAVERLMSDITDKVDAMVQQSIEQSMSARKPTEFFRQTKKALGGFVARLMRSQHERISYLLLCEQKKPVTHSKWKAVKATRLRDLELSRRIQRTNEYYETREASMNIKATPTAKRIEKAKDAAWAQKELGDDDWTMEVDCAATIFAYYDTASTCFLDTVAKHIEYGIMGPLADGDIAKTLHDELRADDDASCFVLLAEDPAREEQRRQLLAEKAKLEKALEEIRALSVA